MIKTIISCAVKLLLPVLQGLYNLMKLRKMKNRVCFFSRQSSTPTLDFRILQERLKETHPEIEQCSIYFYFHDRKDGIIKYALSQIKSMYLLSVSKVCVLDAYWPVVSLLKHREELKVIQLWHSLGKIKKSGYQTLDMPCGRDKKLSMLFKMHKNYDYIITGGKKWNEYYCEAFNTSEEKLRSYGLPRLDWLISDTDKKEKFEEDFPETKDKIIVLYAPTYRTYQIDEHKKLEELFKDSSQYEFICRLHPNQNTGGESTQNKYSEENIFTLLKVCDYLITDYSSLAIEAAALKKETFYFLFDKDRYLNENGLNIDPSKIMPECSFKSAEEIFKAVKSGEYPFNELKRYRNEFLPEEIGKSTENIIKLIAET